MTSESSADQITLDTHRGAIDQTTITTQPPVKVMSKVERILRDMGVEVQEESQFRFRCVRPKRGAEDDGEPTSNDVSLSYCMHCISFF